MKQRLDALLVQRGLEQSRTRASAVIMEGYVFVDGEKAIKPGMMYEETCAITIKQKAVDFVSRGGLKLQKAIDCFELDLNGTVAMDIGASTGGFTDCMLRHGASKVFCVDVGYGQLAWSLRTDDRVVNLERTNIRYVTPEQIGCALDFVSIDVSFISLKLVLPVAARLMREGAMAVALVKPQFEAGKGKVGKKGVVRERAVHEEVINACVGYAKESGFAVLGMNYSPVKGPQGNIEYLMLLQKGGGLSAEVDAAAVVQQSYDELQRKGE